MSMLWPSRMTVRWLQQQARMVPESRPRAPEVSGIRTPGHPCRRPPLDRDSLLRGYRTGGRDPSKCDRRCCECQGEWCQLRAHFCLSCR